MFVAFMPILLLTDFPGKGRTRWLTGKEQGFAVWRLVVSANDEADENGTIRDSIKNAAKDPHVYLLVFTHMGILTSSIYHVSPGQTRKDTAR